MTLDNSSFQAEGGDPKCLHCRLLDAISALFEAKGAVVDGGAMLELHEIGENISQVLAELFAGDPDKKQRDRRLKALVDVTGEAIPIIRARGDGAFPKHTGVH